MKKSKGTALQFATGMLLVGLAGFAGSLAPFGGPGRPSGERKHTAVPRTAAAWTAPGSSDSSPIRSLSPCLVWQQHQGAIRQPQLVPPQPRHIPLPESGVWPHRDCHHGGLTVTGRPLNFPVSVTATALGSATLDCT